MSVTRLRWLLPLLLLLVAVPGEAQRPTWPQDAAGRPAPPCTIWNTATNEVTACSAATPVPVSGSTSTDGQGNPTGSDNDPLGWGRSIFEAQTAFDSRTGAGGTSFRWETESIVTAIRRTAATTITVMRSTDRGRTYSTIQSFAGGFANMGTFNGSLVRSQNGLYATNHAGGGVGAAPFSRSTNLLTWTAATGADVVPTGGTSFAASSLSLSPNTANRLLGVRINVTAATCMAVVSTDGGATFTGTTGEIACAGGQSGQINYIGGTTWLWMIAANGQTRRSSDDGATWTLVASPSGGAAANATICVPTSTGAAGYCLAAWGAAGAQRISRSTDSGTTWTQVMDATAMTNLFLSFTNYGNDILSVITDSVAGVITLWNSNDAGLSWSPGPSVTYTGGSTPTGYYGGTDLNNRTNGSPSNGAGSAVWIPDGVAATQNPLYSSTIPPAGTQIVGTTGIPWTIGRSGRGVITSQQGHTLGNSEVTSAAATANVFNFAATTGERWTIRRIDARCSAGTSSVTVESPVGTTLFTTLAAEVVAAGRTTLTWTPGLTGGTSAAMRITVASCGGGNTSTVAVQADRDPAP